MFESAGKRICIAVVLFCTFFGTGLCLPMTPNVILFEGTVVPLSTSAGTTNGTKIRAEEPYSRHHVYAIDWHEDRIDYVRVFKRRKN